jgi:acyl-[acyl carrier protein]--UDP-N-acetylglucosamine O-acyltransferase
MVVVEAESTRTLSGSGSLRAYVYDPIVAAWFRVPALDLSVNASAIRRMGFESEQIAGLRRATRLDYATDTVTVSAGTTVRVYILGGT